MTRNEIIVTVRAIFETDSEDETDRLIEELITALGSNEVANDGPTADPELIADQILKLPPRRILVTSPPKGT